MGDTTCTVEICGGDELDEEAEAVVLNVGDVELCTGDGGDDGRAGDKGEGMRRSGDGATGVGVMAGGGVELRVGLTEMERDKPGVDAVGELVAGLAVPGGDADPAVPINTTV